MYLSQVEIATVVCKSLAEVRQELNRCRQAVIDAAEKEGKTGFIRQRTKKNQKIETNYSMS